MIEALCRGLHQVLMKPVLLCTAGIVLSLAGAWISSRSRAIPTTKEGALAALEQTQDFIKWLAAIETAVLGGLAAFVFGGAQGAARSLDADATSYAIASTVLLGLALIFAGWVLTSLGSVTARIHASTTRDSSVEFDILNMPLAARVPWILLGSVKTIHHGLWVFGISLAAACIATAHSGKLT